MHALLIVHGEAAPFYVVEVQGRVVFCFDGF